MRKNRGFRRRYLAVCAGSIKEYWPLIVTTAVFFLLGLIVGIVVALRLGETDDAFCQYAALMQGEYPFFGTFFKLFLLEILVCCACFFCGLRKFLVWLEFLLCAYIGYRCGFEIVRAFYVSVFGAVIGLLFFSLPVYAAMGTLIGLSVYLQSRLWLAGPHAQICRATLFAYGKNIGVCAGIVAGLLLVFTVILPFLIRLIWL